MLRHKKINKKYYCMGCKTYHFINSKIGQEHYYSGERYG